MKLITHIRQFSARAIQEWEYVSCGVWKDTRRSAWVSLVKTINLSVRSFLNRDIQTRACAMTYRTLLAVVPAMALLFAIGRGFGLQDLIRQELYSYFPGQHQFVSMSLGFVDSYLSATGEGVFVGIGLLFLLWTLISLLSSVEDVFNLIWGVRQGRGLWRKITDYTAMLLILPVLMICSSGMSALISSTLNSIFHFRFMTPVISLLLEVGSWAMIWLFFTAAYLLIPNTKVKFRHALPAGIFAGTGFMLLQWLFVSGQMYVSKYNAIYGSFSFLPLFLIWMQLVWVITMAGMVLCYSAQNIFQYSFADEISSIAPRYYNRVAVAIMAVVTRRFKQAEPPVTVPEIILCYGLPGKLVSDVLQRCERAGLVYKVVIDEDRLEFGFQPALPCSELSVGRVLSRLQTLGHHDFIPSFAQHFPGVEQVFRIMEASITAVDADKPVADLEIDVAPSVDGDLRKSTEVQREN